MDISILSHKPQFADELIQHLWNEWEQDYVEFTDLKTPQALKQAYLASCTAFILHNGDVLIGSCLIDKEDMQVHPEKSPWLASVFILREYRNKGYATYLLERIIPSYPLLHLWTFNQQLADFYLKLGFQQIEIIEKHGSHNNIIFMIRMLPHTFV